MTNYWLNYPTAYKKQIKPLLHQQMWLFGRDILCPKGNLLYQYQFTHQRAKTNSGVMYTRWDGDQQIALWGWGIWFGQAEKGAIFVNRYKAKPQFTTVSNLSQSIFRETELPHRTSRVNSEAEAQAMQKLFVELLTWLAEYEAWIVATAGKSWRQSSLGGFPHAVSKPETVDQLAEQWQSLATQGEELAINTHTKQE
ncbi:MAG: hypothetical protein AAF490_04690 [Chloroflexota bacterium]